MDGCWICWKIGWGRRKRKEEEVDYIATWDSVVWVLFNSSGWGRKFYISFYRMFPPDLTVRDCPECPVDTEYCGGQLTRRAAAVCHCVAAQTCNYLQVNCSILQHVGLGWARANFILGSFVQLYTDNRTSSGGTRGKLIWQTTVSMDPSYQEPADGIRPRLVIICCIWTW